MKLPDSEKDDIRHFAMKRVKDEFNLRKHKRIETRQSDVRDQFNFQKMIYIFINITNS